MLRLMAFVVLAASLTACDTRTPTTPSPGPGPTSTNQAPQIDVGAVSPALGIADVTTFTVRVEARDPDGDQVSLTASGCSFGTESPVALENGVAILSFTADRKCAPSIGLRASDAKGATAQATVPFDRTSLDGWFRLVIGEGFYSQPYFFVNLTQSGSAITGIVRDGRNHEGAIDASEPGTIDAQGRFRLRFKIESMDDLVVTGQVISSKRQLMYDTLVGSGQVIGARYAGSQFQLWHEAQY